LVLEDNPADVFVIREILAKSGLNLVPRVVRDGRAALDYIQDLERNQEAACPALVLLDLNVPKVDGFDVLRALRRGERMGGIPVIVVTSSTAASDRASARELGAAGYFQKPADLEAYMQLGEVIHRVLTQEK
jgi:CheY-like chemotaxis protein